ncbi:MAG TPA: hypothetical protein VGI39_27090, partial [Polyangiaceae bacterium]
PYLFTRLLLPALERADEARVVSVSSKAHYQAEGIDWVAVRKSTRTVSALFEYQVSKLANVLFSNELGRRAAKSVHTYSLHPGVIASDVWREIPWGVRHLMKLFMISNEEGAKTTLHCATSEQAGLESGRYYDACREKKPSAVALDEKLARELWDRSASWVGLAA